MTDAYDDLRADWCDVGDMPRATCAHCRGVTTPVIALMPERPWVFDGQHVVRRSGRALEDGDTWPSPPSRLRLPHTSGCRQRTAADTAIVYLTREHRPDCKDRACDGCKPCEPRDEQGNPLDHCTTWGCSEHIDPAELTCPRCIARVRSDLQAIEDLTALALHAAIDGGLDTEAANLAGPAADPREIGRRRVAALRLGYDLDTLPGLDEDGHPLHVLGRWELMLREDYDQDYADLPPVTVTRARAYLAALLPKLANDREQDWPLFAREIRQCRAHLEAAVGNSHTPEQGAPCPDCSTPERKGPRLVRHWRNVDDHGHDDLSGASDWWGCPTVEGHWWTEAEYRLRIGTEYRVHALTAAEIHEEHGVRPDAVRQRARRNPKARLGFNERGQRVYDVALILDAPDTEPA